METSPSQRRRQYTAEAALPPHLEAAAPRNWFLIGSLILARRRRTPPPVQLQDIMPYFVAGTPTRAPTYLLILSDLTCREGMIDGLFVPVATRPSGEMGYTMR